MNKNIKKIISMVAAVAIIATVGLGAFSYFTDYATSTNKAVAGTFDIELAHTIDLDGENEILNPGDSTDFKFTVSNAAQKSADIYAVVTITGTTKDAEGNAVAAATASPYKLMLNGEEVDKDSTSTETTYVYILDEKILSGGKEQVANAQAVGGFEPTSYEYAYTFGMDYAARNEWEGSDVDVTIEVFAKQHEHTGNETQAAWKSAVMAEVDNNYSDPVDANDNAGRIWG